jgi:hypothetical protein
MKGARTKEKEETEKRDRMKETVRGIMNNSASD